MRKCGNPDDLRGRRVVVAALLWAMPGKELVHNVLTEVWRTQHAAVGERSFHEKRKLDQVVQRGAEFLQIGLDVCKYDAPLRGRVACGATTFFERFVVVRGCGVAGQEHKSLCPRDHRAFPPRHQAAGLQFFMGDEFHFSSVCASRMELKSALRT